MALPRFARVGPALVPEAESQVGVAVNLGRAALHGLNGRQLRRAECLGAQAISAIPGGLLVRVARGVGRAEGQLRTATGLLTLALATAGTDHPLGADPTHQ